MEKLCGAWKMLNKWTIFMSLANSEVELAYFSSSPTNNVFVFLPTLVWSMGLFLTVLLISLY